MITNKSRIHVFYAGLLVDQFMTFPSLATLGAEVYNGAYIWISEQWKPGSIFEAPGWYRADKTPVLLNDVPTNLRAMALLLQ